MMHTSEQRKEWYRASFEAFEKNVNGEAASELHAIRRAAIGRFGELGFPTTRDEEWRYTDISPLIKVDFKPVLRYSMDGLKEGDLDRFTFDHKEWTRLVFLNGHFSSELSYQTALPEGVIVGSLSDALQQRSEIVLSHLAKHAPFDRNPFAALSTAFLRDGAFVYLPRGIVLELPILLLYVSTSLESEFVSYPRTLIVADENSQASIIEAFLGVGDNVYFTNAVGEFVLGQNAVIEHERLQNESSRAFHVSATHILQGRSSTFVSNAFSFGGSLVRNDIAAVLDGEGAECTLNGLYLGTGSELIDNHTAIEHAKPHCPSHELYKGILDGKSHGVFNGKILVRPDAQKTDAKQTNKNLILSDNASVDTKPELEIYASDVRCTHGATVGQLDEEALFYLRSRGVPHEYARDMLIYAFSSDVIDRVKVVPLREYLQRMLYDRLEEGRKARR